MEAVKSVKDFKRILSMNRESLYNKSINAEDISVKDEWMHEDQWDEIYKQEETGNGQL